MRRDDVGTKLAEQKELSYDFAPHRSARLGSGWNGDGHRPDSVWREGGDSENDDVSVRELDEK